MKQNSHTSHHNEYLRLESNGPFAGETRTLVDKIKKATSQGRGVKVSHKRTK